MGQFGWKTGMTVLLVGMAAASVGAARAQQSTQQLSAAESEGQGAAPSLELSQISAVQAVMPAAPSPTGDVTEDQPRSDPFGLESIAEKAPQVKTAPPGFRPAETLPDRLPAMTLRGIGRMNGKDHPTALIEVGRFGMFVVKENDTISLQGMNGNNVMRIVEISDISVTVEAGSFGELIVVR